VVGLRSVKRQFLVTGTVTAGAAHASVTTGGRYV
jgi:hypothetical protein